MSFAPSLDVAKRTVREAAEDEEEEGDLPRQLQEEEGEEEDSSTISAGARRFSMGSNKQYNPDRRKQGNNDAHFLFADDHDDEQNHKGVKFSQAHLRDMESSKKLEEDQHGDYSHVNDADLDDYFVFEPKHVESLTGFDVTTVFGFYSLFSNFSDTKLLANIPDLVLVAGGQTVHWLFTSKQAGALGGRVMRKCADATTPASVRDQFLRRAKADETNFEGFVAMLVGNGDSKVIRERNFNAFMDSLEREADNGQWLLQEYVKPLGDVGYRVMVTKKGETMDCKTTSFRVSHTYRPVDSIKACTFPTRKLLSSKKGIKGTHNAAPLEQMPPPTEAIVSQCGQQVLSIMGYISQVWKLDLDELECEFVRDVRGRLTLTSVSSFEWREGQLVEGRLNTLLR